MKGDKARSRAGVLPSYRLDCKVWFVRICARNLALKKVATKNFAAKG